MADCEARRLASQEYRCLACGLRWDADDPEPPACGKASKVDFSPPVQSAAVPREAGHALRGSMLTPNLQGVAVVSIRASTIMGGGIAARGGLLDRLSALCEIMRAGTITLGEAADMLEDLTVEVGVLLRR